MDRIGYPAGCLQFFWNRIGIRYLFLKKIESGQDQDICLISITKFSWEWFKMSQMMVLLFSLLLWFLYSQKIKMIWSVCAALITIDDNSCYFIVNIFWWVGSSTLLLYWYAALFCCVEWHVSMLCHRLIKCISLVANLVFTWNRLANFLITPQLVT